MWLETHLSSPVPTPANVFEVNIAALDLDYRDRPHYLPVTGARH
jgi:hypothetical protein